MARAAAKQSGLVRVYFIPAAEPPHRAKGTFASYEDRYRMVELACEPFPEFEPSRIEDRPGKSFTVDTVIRFRETLDLDSRLFWIIGADAFADLPTWHRWRELAEMVTFAVVSRPGAEHPTSFPTRVQRIEGVDLSVSSSEIRQKLAHHDAGVELPAAVLRYIQQKALYGW